LGLPNSQCCWLRHATADTLCFLNVFSNLIAVIADNLAQLEVDMGPVEFILVAWLSISSAFKGSPGPWIHGLGNVTHPRVSAVFAADCIGQENTSSAAVGEVATAAPCDVS
jgi:hypothetical protein